MPPTTPAAPAGGLLPAAQPPPVAFPTPKGGDAQTDPILQIVEVFGPTFQGEGPNLGRRCGFIRLADCNLACGWCDTRYSWDWDTHDRAAEVTERTVQGVLDQVEAMDVPLVIITGGEPLLQKHKGLGELLLACQALGIETNIETNGTSPPTGMPLPDLLVVSLKLAHSGDPEPKRIRPRAVESFAALAIADPERVAWKFVAATPQDLTEIDQLAVRYRLHPDRVWVMPEGRNHTAITDHARALAQPVLDRGWNLTTRLHVTLWSDTRGN